jgi:diguanylate cyclase
MFDGAAELSIINEIIDKVDGSLLPQFRLPGDTTRLVLELQAALDNLKFHLTTLFERHLEVENGRDVLTRLLNRRYLPSVLNRETHLAQQRKTRFALMLLDLDHFKAVNDTYGHDAGDSVLQQAAALVLNSVRNGDFVFRYGGEELLVMVVEVTPQSVLRLAEALRERFAETEFLIGQGRHIRVTTSIGVAIYDGHPDHQYLMNLADQALYQAKQQGRNRVCAANQPEDVPGGG